LQCVVRLQKCIIHRLILTHPGFPDIQIDLKDNTQLESLHIAHIMLSQNFYDGDTQPQFDWVTRVLSQISSDFPSLQSVQMEIFFDDLAELELLGWEALDSLFCSSPSYKNLKRLRFYARCFLETIALDSVESTIKQLLPRTSKQVTIMFDHLNAMYV
jgi:hypothetical protein